MLDQLQPLLTPANWNSQWIGLAAFLGTSGLVCLVYYLSVRRKRVILDRVEELGGEGLAAPPKTKKQGLSRRMIDGIATHLLPGDDSQLSRLQQRMQHAGLYDRSATNVFVIVRLLMMVLPIPLAIVAGTFGLIDHKLSLLVGAVGGGIGLFVPSLWLDRKKARRQLVLERSLPDFLDLLVTCMESGLSLDAALRRVTSELRYGHPVLAREMDCVQNEIDLGTSPDVALHNLAKRTDVESIHTLGTFIHQARKYGTSIGEALRTHAEMLRTQREQRAEEKAQKAAVKVLIPTLLFIFPAVFVVLAGPAAIQLQEHFVGKKGDLMKTKKRK